MLIWLNAASGQLGIEGGVLRSDEVQSLLSLDEARDTLTRRQAEILLQARSEAEAIVEAARQQAESIEVQAQAQIDAARKEGYELGMREAANDWHERQAGHAMQKARALRALNEKLAEIVTTAVERIVQSEEREALYARALHTVQALTHGASALTLRVSPEDHGAASGAIATLDATDSGMRVEVVVDGALKPGSCIFESDLGVLDASLQTQLNAVRQAMDRVVRRALASEADEAEEADEADVAAR